MNEKEAHVQADVPLLSGERIYIDCEFNGGRGALISMALVSDFGEFYEVVDCHEPIQPWVAENVMPILGKPAISMTEFYTRLFRFLGMHKRPVIVADHPADLAYFANAVITDAVGSRYAGMWSAECWPDIRYESAVPHNALEDARAIRRTMRGPAVPPDHSKEVDGLLERIREEFAIVADLGRAADIDSAMLNVEPLAALARRLSQPQVSEPKCKCQHECGDDFTSEAGKCRAKEGAK